MRNLSANAIAQISQKLGNEPIAIVEIAWTLGGDPIAYADRDIGTIPGKILTLTALDNVVNVAGNGQSQEIQIVLDDTDGSLKEIIDTTDIHQREVWVYQYFQGMDLADRFLLFKGQISSPISYHEGERTLSLAVTSQIEDTEIGFSAEEGKFDFVADHLIGKPWPMNFGTVTHGRTLKLTQTHRGILAEGTGVADFALVYRRQVMLAASSHYQTLANRFLALRDFYQEQGDEASVSEAEKFETLRQQYQTQANQFLLGANSVLTVYNEQKATELDQFRVIGGEKFPRGQVSLKIGETIYHGQFQGNTDNFLVDEVVHPKRDELAVSNQELDVPQVPGMNSVIATKHPGFDFPFGHPPIVLWASIKVFGEHAGYVFNRAGSVVELATVEGQEYIASITPGSVLAVSAYLNRNGVRKLVTLPQAYYTVEVQDFGGLAATIIRLTDAMSKIEDAQWEDELYITFQSDIGPNTVDVLEYLIDTYTDFSTDAASFAQVRTRLENYPSHFQIADRKQVLTALQEIAWQARCAIWLSNGRFYLRYLPEEPTPVATFTDSDVDVATLEVGFTPTEDVVTRLVGTWRSTGAQAEDNVVILRHNVKKYGTKERQHDFYIYNNVDSVIKSMTFWLIRYANTWKKARFRTPLHKLNVESLDPVTLDFNKPWLAAAPVVGIVEQANYNSESQQLEFEVWTPVRAGEREPYDFAHPADIDTTLKFPTDQEEQLDFDGGDGPGKNVGEGFVIGVPIGNFSAAYNNPDPYKLLEFKRRFNDRGQPRPSDQNDEPPGDPVIVSTPPLVLNTPGPVSPPARNETPVISLGATATTGGIAEIDFTTPIVDRTDPDNPITTNLGTILQYSAESGIHGARLALLWDEDDDP